MKNMTLFLTTMFLSLTILFPKERIVKDNDASTIMQNGREYQMNRAKPQVMVPSSRDEIIYFDDFEGDSIEWTHDGGWRLTDSDFYSPSHSFNSPNDASTQNSSWNLLSPLVSLLSCEEAESCEKEEIPLFSLVNLPIFTKGN